MAFFPFIFFPVIRDFDSSMNPALPEVIFFFLFFKNRKFREKLRRGGVNGEGEKDTCKPTILLVNC